MNTDSGSNQPSIFISYAHESADHRYNMIDLARVLHRHGFPVVIDSLFETAPPRNWQTWMHRWIKKSDVVLLVGSPKYKSRAEGDEPGTGAAWEGAIIAADLYPTEPDKASKYIPVVPDASDKDNLPYFVATPNPYVVGTPGHRDLNPLLRRLRAEARTPDETWRWAETEINIRYEQLGGLQGTLGRPSSDVERAADFLDRGTTGYYQSFENGILYWTDKYGAQPVHGAVNRHHLDLGGSAGRLGFPAADPEPAGPSPRGTQGVLQRFEHWWAYPEDLTRQLGGEDWGATVYSSDPYGTHATWGSTGEMYERLGGAGGELGFPASQETEAGESPRKTRGYFQRFEGSSDYPQPIVARVGQRCGATIYWSELYGAHATSGPIGARYEELDGTWGHLGFPASDESDVSSPNGTTGRMQRFEGPEDYPTEIIARLGQRCGATVYWSDKHGAHPTFGGIGACYEDLGGTWSPLGFPTTGEVDVSSPNGTAGRMQRFEGGAVCWRSGEHYHKPAIAVHGEAFRIYQELGGPSGKLGFPLSADTEEPSRPSGTQAQEFENGRVIVEPEGHAFVDDA